MDRLRIGMIGCGTVGSGVLELLHRREDELARLLGRRLEVARIAVRDPDRPRQHAYVFVDPDVFTDSIETLTDDPSIHVIVEVAGGVDEPRDWLIRALKHKKDIVTANKATLAFHGAEIFRAARECGQSVYYEASVAAAIPIIEMVQNGLVANQVTFLLGILNGTCNYVLTRMEADHMDYSAALKLAQDKGFAEAEPSLDVSGEDSAHKLTLLARLLTQSHIPLDGVYTEGIENITRDDMEFAAELGYRIKLLAIAHMTDERAWDLRVHPTMIDRNGMLAQVQDEHNAVYIRGDAAGPMLVYGHGAGAFPTASSVVADIVRAAKGDRPIYNGEDLAGGGGGEGGPGAGMRVGLVSIDSVSLRNYVRMTVLDAPGVLGRITSHFGMRGISISSIRQPDAQIGRPVPVVLVTHRTPDRVLTDALADLVKVGLLHGTPTRIRIED